MRFLRITTISLFFSGGAVSAAPPALQVSYERIADVNTPLPNAPQFTFSGIGGGEFVNINGEVSFTNVSVNIGFEESLAGVFQWSREAGITTVADALAPPFDRYAFSQNYTDGASTVYRAQRGNPEDSAIFRADSDSNAVRLFGIGDTLPGGAGAAQEVFWPRVENGDLLFNARGEDGVERVYQRDLSGGPLTTLLDENTPGVEGAGSFALGDFRDGAVAFRTLNQPFGFHTGVYTSDLAGAVTPIAEIGDPMPGAPGITIASVGGELSHPSLSDGKVVYHAFGSDSSSGVFATPVTGGATEVIVDSSMELPNDNGRSRTFGLTSVSGDNVSFLGINAGGGSSALFASIGGQIIDFVHVGDTFDGRLVTGVFASPFGMSGNTLAFMVTFDGFGGGQGLYLATITPAPGAGGVLAIAAAWATRRRRKRG